ncbi:MAG: hypothetical protein M3N35_02010 [Candidatus Binatota bacterium]|nr:hypothetical protein [Candidatus Binatota bacterium]
MIISIEMEATIQKLTTHVCPLAHHPSQDDDSPPAREKRDTYPLSRHFIS